MSKSSKSCGYTGNMRGTNRENNAKTAYESNQAKSHGMDSPNLEQHPKHKVAYPEIAAEQRVQAKCKCKK